MSKKTVGEQIADLEAMRASKVADMQAITNKAIEDGRTKDAGEREEFDNLNAEVKAIDAELVDLREMEALNVKSAKPVDSAPKTPGVQREYATVKNTQKLEPGIAFARYVKCLGLAKGNTMQAQQIAQNVYPEMEDLHGILKAAVAAGTTTGTTWASPLVDYQNFAGDFLDYLRPATIIGQFGQNGVPALRRVPFNVKIAGQTSGGAAGWVGEGKAKPLTAFDFNSVNLGWAKIAAISVVTEELLRFSSPSADGLIRDGLRDAIVERIDEDLIDPAKAAVTGVSPASLTNGVTAVTATAGNTAASARADLQQLYGKYLAANLPPTSAVLIMSATAALNLSLMQNALGQSEFSGLTMRGGTLGGLPVIVSDHVPVGTVIMVNAQDVFLADDGLVTIDASREASLEMADNPAHNSGTPTGATAMVSMFQTNSVAIRAERYINWAKRRAAAVQFVEDAEWAGAAPAGP